MTKYNLYILTSLILFSLADAAALDRHIAPRFEEFTNNTSIVHTNNQTSISAGRLYGINLEMTMAQGFKTNSCGFSKFVRRRLDIPTRTKRDNLNARPTPEPTGEPSGATTVHINNNADFALLLPATSGELISEAENDGQSYCTPGATGCISYMPDGLITAAAVSKAPDGSWIQITGCMDSSKFHFATNDDGGQFDVRFPNGAQCSFGGYGASFIEQVEPSANRFCLRCCSSADDQTNCNSHQDTAGCLQAIPGTYTFPNVNCA